LWKILILNSSWTTQRTVKKIKLNYTVFGNKDKQQLKVYNFFCFLFWMFGGNSLVFFCVCNPSDIDDLSRIRLSCSSGILLELSYPVYRWHIGDCWRIMLFCLGPFILLLSQIKTIIWLSNLLTLSVPNAGHSGNASWTLI
jgi:hypothetical protein